MIKLGKQKEMHLMPRHTSLSKRLAPIVATVLLGDLLMLVVMVISPPLTSVSLLLLVLLSGAGTVAVVRELWEELTYRWRK